MAVLLLGVVLPSSLFFIRLANVHVVHPCSSIDTTAAWKKLHFFFFHRSGLTSVWPITYRWLSMTLLVAYWCLSRLMRHCFQGRWTCLVVSESYCLVWRCYRFDYSTYIPSFVRWHKGLYPQLLLPDDVARFWLVWVHLPEALYRRRSWCQLLFVRSIFCFFPLSVWNRFLWFLSIDVLST